MLIRLVSNSLTILSMVRWNKMKSGVGGFDAYWLCRIATVHLLTLSDSFAGFVLATIV